MFCRFRERQFYKGGILMSKWWIVLIAYVAMVTVNALANILPINGMETSTISDKIDVLFTPAGYVFSIWGLIYLLVGVWVVLQYKKFKANRAHADQAYTLFIASCALNIGWLLCWHYEIFAFGQVLMFALLISLILLYRSFDDTGFGGRLPFSIYLGWISVATIANMAYTLKHYDISLGVSEPVGTIVLLIVAATLALLGQYRENDALFTAVFIWAIIGIAQSNTEQLVVIGAYVAAAVIFFGGIAMSFLPNKKLYA